MNDFDVIVQGQIFINVKWQIGNDFDQMIASFFSFEY